MIHILKSRSGYRVRYIGRNNEILSVSEVLKTKQSAWKNVRAMMKVFDAKTSIVQDGADKYIFDVTTNDKYKFKEIKP